MVKVRAKKSLNILYGIKVPLRMNVVIGLKPPVTRSFLSNVPLIPFGRLTNHKNLATV